MGDTTVATLARDLSRHLDECMAQNRDVNNRLSSLADGHRDIMETLKDMSAERRDFNAKAWQGVGAVALIILSGLVTIFVSNYTMHQETATKADLVAIERLHH